eukprot:747394-Hanusia_phi.AAC.4
MAITTHAPHLSLWRSSGYQRLSHEQGSASGEGASGRESLPHKEAYRFIGPGELSPTKSSVRRGESEAKRNKLFGDVRF